MTNEEIFEEVRRYGKIVRDDEMEEKGIHVRITIFNYAGSLFYTIRRNGKLFFLKEYATE